MIEPAVALRAVRAVLTALPRAVVLVDGRSGSGKSTFAGALEGSAAVLRLDDSYPGWDGLDATSRALVDRVLVPRSAGAGGVLPSWDWSAGHAGHPLLHVPAGGPLVVEGCGALTRRAAMLADLRVWVELPEEDRRTRALDRDGAAYAPHWERWARQERRFIAREDPRRWADLVIDGRRFPQALFSARSADAH